MRFTEACARDADERRLLVEFFEVSSTGITHGRVDTANQLGNGIAEENLVFLLWGSFAIKKQALVAPNRGHLILTAPHPSPLSAYRGFFGCKHFSKANEYLKSKGLEPIDWSIK